jgi:predicted metal-dependent hydrolase
LVVVVPRGFDRAHIPQILEEKRQWIVRAAAELKRKGSPAGLSEAELWPQSIDLRFLDEVWRVEYRQSANGTRTVQARDAGDRLVRVSGNVSDGAGCRRALARWLLRKGRETLVPAAKELAWANGFELKRVTVRRQRTRWGSCSRDQSVSLNAKLLFLPPELVDYVVLHELCHTIHMNHSRRFWELLATYDKDLSRHRRELRAAAEFMPGWLTREDGSFVY